MVDFFNYYCMITWSQVLDQGHKANNWSFICHKQTTVHAQITTGTCLIILQQSVP